MQSSFGTLVATHLREIMLELTSAGQPGCPATGGTPTDEAPPDNIAAHLNEAASRPCFFTDAMWSAWRQRPDARGHVAVADPEAQREFVVWWLLYGQAEYPAEWWFGSEHVAVAMEPVEIEGQRLPRLVRRLYTDRQDVRAAFPLRDAEGVAELLCWYRLSGPDEMGVAPALPAEFLRLTEAPSGRSPWAGAPEVPRMAAAFYERRSDLQRLFDPSAREAREALVRWYANSGSTLIPSPTPFPDCAEPGRW